MLLITEYIAKHELKPLRKYFTLDDILEGAQKVFKNLAVETKPSQKLKGFKFFKVRIGRKIKGRMLVFMVIKNNKIVPILIRLKKDKVFGMNMSMNNPEVIKQINRNFDRILEDIKNNRFEEF